jgi:hypothetical protein
MKELIKAAFGFAWSMTLLSLQQMTNTFAPDIEGSRKRTTKTFATVAHSTEAQLGENFQGVYQKGDSFQKGAIDLLYSTANWESFNPRGMMRNTFAVMQYGTSALATMLPIEASRLAWQELQNKLTAFNLFTHVDSILDLPDDPETPLVVLLQKTAALDSYSRVWATEGIGYYFAERQLARKETSRNLLSERQMRGVKRESLIALYAGLGLALANCLLAKIEHEKSIAAVETALKKHLELCEANTRAGYTEVMHEALGLAAGNLYPHLLPVLDQELRRIDENLATYFWHGIGRGLYFAPSDALSICSSRWRGALLAQSEPPDESGRLNALAGWAWALTLVNIQHPEIVAAFIQQHDELCCASDASTNGVSSAVIIWHEAMENDEHINSFLQYEDKIAYGKQREQWRELVRLPCVAALRDFYPQLRERERIGNLFRYRAMKELVEEANETKRATEPR